MEIEYGLQLSPGRARTLAPVMQVFLDSIVTLEFDDADAQAAGTIRAALQRKGKPVGTYDVMIAGCALARGLVVVRSNLREFQRIDGLAVENWR